jgi:hypothetical protein
MLASVTALIDDGVREGVFSPVDPETAAFAILGMCLLDGLVVPARRTTHRR